MKKLTYKREEEYLFVDGYNIINFWDAFNGNDNLENQRQKLMDILSEYSFMTSEKIILVFDGYMVKKSPGTIFEYKGIVVVYTKEFETADHFIEHELNDIGRVRRVRVATSDNIEQQIILARGGSRVSAREFEIEVEYSMNKLKTQQKELKTSSNGAILALNEENITLLKNLKDEIE